MFNTTATLSIETEDELIELFTNLIAIADPYNTEDEDSTYTVTIGFNNDLTEYGYQTGDNSFSGIAYFYPNWVVLDVYPDSDPQELLYELNSQINSFV